MLRRLAKGFPQTLCVQESNKNIEKYMKIDDFRYHIFHVYRVYVWEDFTRLGFLRCINVPRI